MVDDVTSHLAASVDKHYSTTNPTDNTAAAPGRPPLRVSLLHNPSHLEIVGCVAAGGLPYCFLKIDKARRIEWPPNGRLHASNPPINM